MRNRLVMFKELRGLLSQTFVYGLSTGFGKLMAVFLMPIYMRFLSPSDYGVLAIVAVTTGFMSVFLSMSLKSSIFRFYYDRDEKARKQLVGTIFLLIVFVNLPVVSLLIFFASHISKWLLDSGAYWIIFSVSFVSVFLGSINVISLGLLRAEGKARYYSIIVNSGTLTSIIVSIMLVVVFKKGVLGIVLGSLSGAAVLCGLGTFFLKDKIAFSFDKALAMDSLSYSIPLMFAALPVVILTMSDRFFLKWYSAIDQVGLYTIGYKIGNLIQLGVVWPFILAWGPFVISISNKPNHKHIYAKVLDYYLIISLLLTLGISILAKDILMWVAPPAFWNAYRVVILVALSYTIYGVFGILNAGIYITKKTKYVPITTGVAAVLNLALNYLLIPIFGMMGAATATLISFAAMTLLMALL